MREREKERERERERFDFDLKTVELINKTYSIHYIHVHLCNFNESKQKTS